MRNAKIKNYKYWHKFIKQTKQQIRDEKRGKNLDLEFNLKKNTYNRFKI